MAGKEDEVMIDQDPTEPLEIEFEEEKGEGEGDDTVAGAAADDKTAKQDAAPKITAGGKEAPNETEEEARERRRQERKERKERQKEARERTQAELAELRAQVAEIPTLKKQLAEVQSKSATSETNAGLQRAQADLQVVEGVIAKATEDGNGQELVKAMRVRDQIQAHIFQLRSGGGGPQTRTDNNQQPTRQQTQAPQLPEAVRTRFDAFAKDHPEYKVRGQDEYSLMVRAIDQAVANEGFDPATDDYWEEVRDRVQQKLGGKPAVANNTQGKQTAKGGPAVGSGRSQVMPGRQSYTLTQAHLEAIKLAGKDVSDPEVLRHYAKVYQKADRQNASA